MVEVSPPRVIYNRKSLYSLFPNNRVINKKSDYILHTGQWHQTKREEAFYLPMVRLKLARSAVWLTDTNTAPLVSPTGLHCQSNHVSSANPFRAYMSHHHWVQEWNYTMTKLFSLAHKASWFGNIRRGERKGCGRKHCKAFVVAHESSHSCRLAKWAHLFEIISWHLNFQWAGCCEWLVLTVKQATASGQMWHTNNTKNESGQSHWI